ncbi:MAG: hypothetical protein ABIB47_05270 [Candidatus Woesearchaeota archaeon]
MEAENRFDVLSPVEYSNGSEMKTLWQRVGNAFRTKDGTGMHIHLNALPLNGKLLIKQKKKKEE